MRMLTKFESKSNRVKGVAFHPKLPLLAASLHSGSIQIWNYQMGTLMDRYDEHEGPVRGIAFHPTQPIFASGGDDYKIKVYNYKTRRCLYTLHGHLDYIRTVVFHHEQPWILSASDDQTCRIFNWQSRQCIAILTGHNHYIMCAKFHPTEDLIVSASMDQTIRVWDISGLRKKMTTAQPMSLEEQLHRANSNAQADLFGNTDVIVKFVLEGHDRGVNWVSWHPTLPLIISAGDDRVCKLWRVSETKAWEVDTCRGHFNNVSCTLFHPKHELILSNGEDKTIRVWDLTKRNCIQTFRRENDRFWVLTSHPTLNLFAAGHDSGLIVFKLDRERPAYTVSGNTLFYASERYIRAHDLTTGTEAKVISVRKLGSQYVPPRTLSYNPAERVLLLTAPVGDAGQYHVSALPRDVPTTSEPKESGADGRTGAANAAVFVARNRFASLDRASQQITVRDLSNHVTKTFRCPAQTNDIFYGGTGNLLLSTPTNAILWDIQQQKQIAEIATPGIKHAIWNSDGTLVALLSKHCVFIADKFLRQSNLIHETIRIKSGVWDDSGVFIYSTLNHIKYALSNGDNGIIKTLEQPVYLTKVRGKNVHCLNRAAKPITIPIDPTEYHFKLALIRQNYDEVLNVIRESNLVGQSIIAYLQKKGYPEIALHFVQDKSTRFDLAIECGNLDIAAEVARDLQRDDLWMRLAQQALRQGDHKVVETAYQSMKNFDRLSFLYLITGNNEKLGKMTKIAEMRGNHMSRFHNALYQGDVQARVSVLRDVGMHPLAYLTAKTNGLDDLAQEVLSSVGLKPENVTHLEVGTSQKPLGPPPMITSTADSNWPLIGERETFFEKAVRQSAAGEPVGQGEQTGVYANGTSDNMGFYGDMEDGGPVQTEEGIEQTPEEKNEEVSDDDNAWNDEVEDEDEDAWDIDEEPLDVAGEDGADAEGLDVPTATGVSEFETWIRNSPLAHDHAAAGSFKTAMQLLNRQVGAVNFEPLKPLFLSTYRSSKMFMPTAASLPPLEVGLRRNPDLTSRKTALPRVNPTLESVKSNELKAAFTAFKSGKFSESERLFRTVLQTSMLIAVETEEQDAELREIIVTCREYLIGLALEIERRKVQAENPDNNKRQLELAAYFTHCKLQPSHLALALRLAMTTFQKAKNLPSAASFAQRLLALGPDEKVSTSARNVIAAANRNPNDAISIDYKPDEHFDICPASLTPIYETEATAIPGAMATSSSWVEEPLTGAKYKEEYSGQVCKLTQVTEIGKQATGLKTM